MPLALALAKRDEVQRDEVQRGEAQDSADRKNDSKKLPHSGLTSLAIPVLWLGQRSSEATALIFSEL
ncbi:MAG TPA: hypothetical protein V6C90_05965 [Coleofasciculaceae cyanobacterium]